MALNLSGLYNQASGFLPSSTKGLVSGSNTVFDLLNPSSSRLSISGLLPGAISGAAKAVPNIGFQGTSGTGGATAASEDDWRVRVSLATGAKIFYQDPAVPINNLMTPLVETNGVVWPYVPQITMTHNANYSSAALTHSNYPAHFYNNSEVADIQISGEFTVQNQEDGQYLMAAIYFFRAATKMFFGQGANVGNPPPMVFLDGYGSHYFPHVPCVITSFQHTMPSEVDYIQVPINRTTLEETPMTPGSTNFGAVNLTPDEQKYVPSLLQASKTGTKATTAPNFQYNTITSSTRVPTVSTVSVTLRPVYSRKNIHERFDLDKFAQGALLQDKDKGFGGFI